MTGNAMRLVLGDSSKLSQDKRKEIDNY